MSIKLQEEGRRIYLIGDTYAIKDRIKDMGGKWDGDRRAWWVGSAKREQAAKLAEAPPAAATEDAARIQVIGKVRYKDRLYYVRWAGTTKAGKESVRLTTVDGKLDFWADAAEVQWEKRYNRREFRGRDVGYPTLGSIQRFIADAKQAKSGDCPRCRDKEPYMGSGDYEECPLCGATYSVR